MISSRQCVSYTALIFHLNDMSFFYLSLSSVDSYKLIWWSKKRFCFEKLDHQKGKNWPYMERGKKMYKKEERKKERKFQSTPTFARNPQLRSGHSYLKVRVPHLWPFQRFHDHLVNKDHNSLQVRLQSLCQSLFVNKLCDKYVDRQRYRGNYIVNCVISTLEYWKRPNDHKT